MRFLYTKAMEIKFRLVHLSLCSPVNILKVQFLEIHLLSSEVPHSCIKLLYPQNAH
jgi:hypothetical protein